MDDYKEKVFAARSQLRTALLLFIGNIDPISVHVLACGACELLSEINKVLNNDSISLNVENFIRDYEPETKLRKIRNANWNAFKHVKGQNNDLRNDAERIRKFSDLENDVYLFQGFSDLGALREPQPIEGQLFTLWFIANYPDCFAPELVEVSRAVFNFEPDMPRKFRKDAFRIKCEEYRRDNIFAENDRLDTLPLDEQISLLD